eukprot:TRINITY_DN6597_c0_g2_i1.p2 TRINITY_DN6597_c0_g2~~TRINITY_DN6597_c0_g2_i1.p2  ORF type:complete len:111 (+),score=13.27 TRINITY_DN6597_c0_g2_i1:989-1321(+)
MERNKELEFSPSIRKYNYRLRDAKREIGPSFRFRANNNSERVADSIQSAGISQLISEKTFFDPNNTRHDCTSKGHLNSKLIQRLLYGLSLIHICRCRRLLTCRSRWSPYH